jgi:hypothetical protein
MLLKRVYKFKESEDSLKQALKLDPADFEIETILKDVASITRA